MKPQPPRAAQPDTAAADSRQCLSALADGETQGDPQAVARACGLWRDDAQARQAWHRWHLIGDVLRSEELAQDPARDAAFLSALRVKLAAEPVVLAPAPAAPTPVPTRWRQAWLAPAAVAAGFVAVAGVLVVARTSLPEAPAGVQALATPSLSAPARAAAASAGITLASVPGAAPMALQTGAALIRDPRLDSYLRAHQSARGNFAAAVPGGGMRNVEAVTTPGPER